MKKILEESGMKIFYGEKSTFLIEKSKLVTRMQGVKIVEFVELYNGNKLKVVEAKTSSPCCDNNVDDYNAYINDIVEKFQNAVSIINSCVVGRRSDIFREFPAPMQKADYKSIYYRLLLLIKNCNEEWMAPLVDDLRKHLRPFLKCWNIKADDFMILNEDLARQKGIIE